MLEESREIKALEYEILELIDNEQMKLIFTQAVSLYILQATQLVLMHHKKTDIIKKVLKIHAPKVKGISTKVKKLESQILSLLFDCKWHAKNTNAMQLAGYVK